MYDRTTNEQIHEQIAWARASHMENGTKVDEGKQRENPSKIF